jgi:competence protein ComGC
MTDVQPSQPPAPPLSNTQAATPGTATASLVLGILSLLCLGLLAGIPAVICGHKARGRIQRANGTLKGDGLALAGLIMGYISIGLTVVLIPMYAAIAIPSFVNARDKSQENACVNNLRQMSGAKDEYALDNNNAVPGIEDLVPTYISRMPVCPKGGQYELGVPGEYPACSVPGHTL